MVARGRDEGDVGAKEQRSHGRRREIKRGRRGEERARAGRGSDGAAARGAGGAAGAAEFDLRDSRAA